MAKQLTTSVPAQINMIGEGTVFEGTLRARNDVRISGSIVGQLHVEGKAIVAPEGTLEGELVATQADIAGKIQGQLTVTERLVLKSSARIDGDIRAGQLVVEEGALFNGKCEMGPLSPSEPQTNGKTARKAAPVKTDVHIEASNLIPS